MYTIVARNVNHALPMGLNLLQTEGVPLPSRNGPVLTMPGPVMTEYQNPLERVLFNEVRDANPFFHLVESLWMLAGRRDVATPAFYVSRMRDFSQDGVNLDGAYGYRWINHFEVHQLHLIIAELRKNPHSRRLVLSMWDGNEDLEMGAKMRLGRNNYVDADADVDTTYPVTVPNRLMSPDVPCNTHCYFRARDGHLDMTILCRSNDVVWGAYGANAVHFSYLLEYVAFGAGLVAGTMYQFSNDYHIYTERADVKRLMEKPPSTEDDLYTSDSVCHVPLIQTDLETFDRELKQFFERPDAKFYAEPFFMGVALPVRAAYRAHKQGRTLDAIDIARTIKDDAWSLACTQWLNRRLDNPTTDPGPCAMSRKS